IPDYIGRANDEMCLLVQIETREGLQALDESLAVDGVDGVFIGPADLSATMGHMGNPGHPEVRAAIDDAIVRIVRAGKAAGILHADAAQARHCLELGATDRKSTRLNSSHVKISYAVFCLKKKTTGTRRPVPDLAQSRPRH